MKYGPAKQKPGRGGYRPNSGAKCADGAEVTTLISARVDDAAFNLITEMGDGSISMGVRKVCAELLRLRNSGMNPGTPRAPTKQVLPEVVAPRIKYAGKWLD